MPPSNPYQQPTTPSTPDPTPTSSEPDAPNNYDFIVNPPPPPRRRLFSNTALPTKIALIGGSIVIVLILLNIVQGIISGPSVGEKFLNIAQDQQQIVTIATAVSQERSLSTKNSNSAMTAQLGIASDQAKTIEYMAKNGKKVKAKDLDAKLDGTITEQLEAAAAAGTYNQTYETVMKQQLEAYMSHISQLHEEIHGKNGQALLNSNYDSAKLLLQQLQTP